MIQELVFTSARAGLQIGKSGFCTVASTPGMAENLVRLLESLSGYRHVFPAGSTSAAQNPVVYSHFTSRVGGQPMHILSRIADAGLDYSNRSNKLAHHVVIPNAELSDGDPIGILTEPDQFVTRWDREPEKLRPRTIEGRYLMPAPCATWQRVTGDAGWAGSLVDAFLSRQIAYVIVDSTTPALELIGEALALLPAEDRWRVTFSSFFTNLPPQTECLWRFVMADSPEAATALRSPTNRVINTTQPLSSPSNRFAEAARAGETIQTSVSVASTGLLEIDDSESALPLATPLLTGATANGDLRIRPPENMASGQKQVNYGRLHRPPQMANESERTSKKITVTLFIVAAVCLLLAVVLATVLFTDFNLSRVLAELRSSTSDKPASDKPASDKPASDKPASDKPASDKPAADKPAADKPAADKPAADKPASDKPASDKPAADKPANDQHNDEPTIIPKKLNANSEPSALLASPGIKVATPSVITLKPTMLDSQDGKVFDVCQISGDVSKLNQSLVVDLDITLLDSDKYQITKQTGPDKYGFDIKSDGTLVATLELISPVNDKAMTLRFKLRQASESAVCAQFVRISSKNPDGKELQIEGPIIFPLSDPSVAYEEIKQISADWGKPPAKLEISDSTLKTRLFVLKAPSNTALQSNEYPFDNAIFPNYLVPPEILTCKITYDSTGKKHQAIVTIKAAEPEWVGDEARQTKLDDDIARNSSEIKGFFAKGQKIPDPKDSARAFKARKKDSGIGNADEELRLIVCREAIQRLIKFFQAVKDEEEARERLRNAKKDSPEEALALKKVTDTENCRKDIKKKFEHSALVPAGELEKKLKDGVLFGYTIDPTPDDSVRYIKAFYLCNKDLADSKPAREEKLKGMLSIINDHIVKDWNSISKELSGTVPRDEQ